MPSYYSIVRYVPDPATGECVNLGVIVVGEDFAQCKFLDRWRRPARFANASIFELRELAEDFVDSCGLFGLDDAGTRIDVAKLEDMSQNWQNVVQVTSPRGSTLSPTQLLENISSRFLRVDERDNLRMPLTKRDAVACGKNALTQVKRELQLDEKFQVVGKHDAAIHGRAPHRCDYGMMVESKLRLGGFGLSLETYDEDWALNEIDRIYGATSDIRAVHANFPLSLIVVGNPDDGQRVIDSAESLLLPNRVDVLRGDQAQEWALTNVWGIASTIGHG